MRGLLLLCVLVAGCGADGAVPVAENTAPPNQPQCCESTALIADDFSAAEQQQLADYDARQAGIGCCNGSHLAAMRDNAIDAARLWANDAFQIVDGYGRSMEVDGQAVSDLVEDYRLSVLDHVLAGYDNSTSSPGWAGNESAVQQARQQLIDGVHAEFDQLQIALASAGY